MATNKTIEERLRALEDRIAIYQSVSGYGYAVDGMNGDAVGACFAPDAVYAVGDHGAFNGRAQIAGITSDPRYHSLIKAGCGHISTVPYVVINGDRASATCHTTVVQHSEKGFYIARVSAARLELSRTPQGGWEADHRQHYLLNGKTPGAAMLGRLNESPCAKERP